MPFCMCLHPFHLYIEKQYSFGVLDSTRSQNGERQEIDPKINFTYQTRAHTSHVWPLQQKEPSRVFDAVKGYCLANA